jgi:hypothetical protein
MAPRKTDPVWADAWRESPAVEQTLARLTEALSRDQRALAQAKTPPASHGATRRGGVRASYVIAASCLALLAAVGGLAVPYGWQSDNLRISKWFGDLASSFSSTGTLTASQEPEEAAAASETPQKQAAAATDTQSAPVETGKTVATTRLVVENASGEALQYIPLTIRASAPAGADRPAIKLSGLPSETLLTSGEDLGNGSWLLKPGEEEDLKLAVQTNAPGEIVIGVEAIEMKTGDLAAPPQELRVAVSPPKPQVQPAAETVEPALPPQKAPAVEPPSTAAEVETPPELPALPAVEDRTEEPQVKVAAAAPTAAANMKLAATEPAKLPEPEAEVIVQPAAAPKVEMDIEEPQAVVAAEPATEAEPVAEAPAAPKAEVSAAPEPEVKVAAVDPLVVSTMQPAEVSTPAATSSDATLISRGDSLMFIGEIIGARSFYNRAYDRGDAAAALSIARTYDPLVYAKLNVMGLKPNAEKALEWYRKAEAAGISAATSDIADLEAFLATR